MKAMIFYICEGCDYKWSNNFNCPVKIAAKIANAGRRIVVPKAVSPCCGDSGRGEDVS